MALHETIHIHQNLFRKRTRGDEEALLTSVCLEVNMSVWGSFHLEERGRLVKSKHQTKKEVRECKVCSQFPCLQKPPELLSTKSVLLSKCQKVLLSVSSLSCFFFRKKTEKWFCFRLQICGNSAANLLSCENQ